MSKTATLPTTETGQQVSSRGNDQLSQREWLTVVAGGSFSVLGVRLIKAAQADTEPVTKNFLALSGVLCVVVGCCTTLGTLTKRFPTKMSAKPSGIELHW